ncbi:MAG: tRNA (N6-isopentenyl adenosine(37)-C2)-methylthiotransferase MiaB [Lachnospiraceae bacterium]|nr:tRNA (N6-isopentenyl adenosine(37)-C2)-methylthiotransferase MiaB [Lachnospiraceae bacterium]
MTFEEKSAILNQAPDEEPSRQFFFIERCKEIIAEKAAEKGRPLTACVNTFGCQMNAKDSEKLIGILKKIGYQEKLTEDADFVLYNTCTVREHANVRVYGRLGVLKKYKDENPDMIIALCGCMMQEEEVVAKIRQSYRHVDLIFGTHNIYKLAELLFHRFTEDSMQVEIMDAAEQTVENLPAERKFKFKCGVNIMYGCNNFCSYCIVPYVRGRERSRLPEDILDEVKRLAEDGVKEVMLLGQNVNSYAYDFPKLLQAVSEVPGIEHVRFMTSHPKDLSDALIETIQKNAKISRHIHLPLQSGSSRILKEMNRHYSKEDYLALADKIRREIPDASITTDIIVGFPGETEEDFLDTLDVVRKVCFDSAFTFIYSKRTGTRAAEMPNQVPKSVSQDRLERLLKVVSETASTRTGRLTGSVQKVLVEEENAKLEGYLTGRLSGNSVVHFKGPKELIGSFVNVRLNEAKGFYYIGELEE